MKTIGTVIAILSKQYLLIKLLSDIKDVYEEGTVLTVFKEIDLSDGKEIDLKISTITFPKGEVSIIQRQKENVYLASTITTVFEKKTVYKNSPIGRGLTLGLTGFLGLHEEEVTEVAKNITAKVDASESMNLDFDKKIQIGDRVSN